MKVPPGVMNPPLLPVQVRFPLSVKAPGPSKVPPLTTRPPTVLPVAAVSVSTIVPLEIWSGAEMRISLSDVVPPV